MAEKTAYVILRRNDVVVGEVDGVAPGLSEERWEAVATLDAHSGDAAKKAYAEYQAGKPDAWDSAWLVAVPARSWVPEPVTIAKRVIVTLGTAG